jgi:hypothetical protein
MNDFAPEQNYQNLNASNANKTKQDMSYFGAMKRKYPGEINFIWHLKPEQIQKSAKERIFREMVRGTIDYSENGQYFQDPKFLENLITAARDELINNTIVRDALRYYNYCFPGQPLVIQELARYENLVVIMEVLYNKLNETKFTGNIGPLTEIQYVYGSYRNIL